MMKSKGSICTSNDQKRLSVILVVVRVVMVVLAVDKLKT